MNLNEQTDEKDNKKKPENPSLFCLDFSYPEGEGKPPKITIEKYTQKPIQYFSVGIYRVI